MAKFIDTIVVGIILVGGLFVLYKPLKEPIDRVFGLIAKGVSSLIEKISSAGGTAKDNASEIITYG